jgi:hypothetical protein
MKNLQVSWRESIVIISVIIDIGKVIIDIVMASAKVCT